MSKCPLCGEEMYYQQNVGKHICHGTGEMGDKLQMHSYDENGVPITVGTGEVDTKRIGCTLPDGVQLDKPEMPCTCRLCLYDREENISALTGEPDFMVVCSICGNKRCPHATNHKLPCTNSNETNQEGSWFADVVDAETEQARQKYLEKISHRTALSPKPEKPIPYMDERIWAWGEGGNGWACVDKYGGVLYLRADKVRELVDDVRETMNVMLSSAKLSMDEEGFSKFKVWWDANLEHSFANLAALFPDGVEEK